MVVYNIKKFIYSVYRVVFMSFCRLIGRRKINAFGKQFYVTPDTIFPSYHHFKIPKKPYPDRIVQYGDFVQLNAVCAHLLNIGNDAVIIDVGAHHGAYAIICGKLVQGIGGKVIAVEPNPKSYEVLVKNIQLNLLEDTVIPLNCGVYNMSGKMYLSDNGPQSQLGKGVDGPRAIDVVTVDWILTKYKIRQVDILLIDVEGAELPVLQGFPWDTIPVGKIFCELHPYAWPDFSYTPSDFSDFLSDHSLKCFDMYFQEHHLVRQKAYIGPTLIVATG